jgi:H+/Cl- antiporter ClcA
MAEGLLFLYKLTLKTMNDILNLMYLGILAGLISVFWTRICKKNMIFRKLGKWMERYNNRHVLMFKYDSVLAMFLRCAFCLQVWIVFLLSFFYIITYEPYWIFAIIGVFGALGSGNLVCEVVHALRNEG